MAHIVGVPRRDPCQKCKLPVFLAERVLIGKAVYHRTCLKCARCGAQLTPGCFYETETNDEFCCETCPDELPQSPLLKERESLGGGHLTAASNNDECFVRDLRHWDDETVAGAAAGATGMRRTSRSSSIADRLAFFENSQGTKSHNASVKSSPTSDEEKQQQINRNLARSSFLKTTIAQTNLRIDGDDDDDVGDGDDKSNIEPTANVSPLRTKTIESYKNPLLIEEPDIFIPDDDDDARELRKGRALEGKALTAPGSPLATSRVTKVAIANIEAELELELDDDLEQQLAAADEVIELTDPDMSTLTRLSKVSAQLQQLEEHKQPQMNATSTVVRAEQNQADAEPETELETAAESELELETKPDAPIPECVVNDNKQLPLDDNILLEKLEIVESNDGSVSTAPPPPPPPPLSLSLPMPLPIKAQKEPEPEPEPQSELEPEPEPEHAARLYIEDDEAAKECVEQEAATNSAVREVVAIAAARRISGVALTTEKDNNKTLPKPAQRIHKPTKQQTSTAAEAAKTGAPCKIKRQPIDAYPEDLNPFASDDDDDDDNDDCLVQPQTMTQIVAAKQTASSNIPTSNASQLNNPFDSSDDEIEIEKLAKERSSMSRVPPPRPPPPRIVRHSVDERTQTAAAATAATTGATAKTSTPNKWGSYLSLMSIKRLPLPKPRKSLSQSQSSTPEPTPRMSTRNAKSAQSSEYELSSPNASAIYGSNSSLNISAASTPGRMPLQRNSELRASMASLASTASGTGRYRKARRAPAPPPSLSLSLSPSPSPSPATGSKATADDAESPVRRPGTVFKELFPEPNSFDMSSSSVDASEQLRRTPLTSRKKRPAPAPPEAARAETNITPISAQTQSVYGYALNITEQEGVEQQLEPLPSPLPSPRRVQNEITDSKNVFSYPLQCKSDSKTFDEDAALLEGNPALDTKTTTTTTTKAVQHAHNNAGGTQQRRVIPLPEYLLSDNDESTYHYDDKTSDEGSSDDIKQRRRQQMKQQRLEQEEANIVYRRVLAPPDILTPPREISTHELFEELADSLKLNDAMLKQQTDNKETRRRSNTSSTGNNDNNDNNNTSPTFGTIGDGNGDGDLPPYLSKSLLGKWKRRKGPAPALPIPPRKVLQMLPLQEIRHELEIIEIQQQGLERQGVVLEQMIRDRCEGQTQTTEECKTNGGASDAAVVADIGRNSKEVEDLILQLFELVNEKNELFRRQAELMYIRRQHRLEQEQADIEYEIRVLMGQPERNKTDTDKAREEALIARLVEVVELRNEVINSLEMDRVREHEEDLSIKQRLEQHNAKRASFAEAKKSTPKALVTAAATVAATATATCSTVKLSKHEKKLQKEAKKLNKGKQLDNDKDNDESAARATTAKTTTTIAKDKKKKRKLFF